MQAAGEGAQASDTGIPAGGRPRGTSPGLYRARGGSCGAQGAEPRGGAGAVVKA